MKLSEDANWAHKFPEEDVLDLPVEHFGKTIQLKSYRYPPKEFRKAVVFKMHGYGSYSNYNAALAKSLADNNYEVFAIDQRCFGFSEGDRAIIQNKEDVYSDQWLMIFEAIKKFKIDQQKTPIFLFGRSFGGLLATNMASGPIASALFSGIAVLTPYYHLWTEKLYEARTFLRVLDTVHPNYVIPSALKERDPEWKKSYQYLDDDPTYVQFLTARTGMMWIEEQERYEEILKETDIPFLFIEAEKDETVSNTHIRAAYESAKEAGK